MADRGIQSIDYITKSGNYLCRPKCRIFKEHELYSKNGEVARKATREDIIEICENNNEAASTGNPAKLTFGHTLDDIYDDKGVLVRHFSEEEQPPTRGIYLNYVYEEIKDGKDKGKLALYADEWIQKVIPNEKGQPVDGPTYAATFPGRSAEYLKRKRLIDSVALLRRTPALDLGIDMLPYSAAHPERVFYSADRETVACVEDSRGKWRYAYGEDMSQENPSSPAAPADDRTPPATGTVDDGWTPEHQHFAEQAIGRGMGMHHSHAAALMNHAHSMYAAQLGLPPDKMTPHAPVAPAGAAPTALAGAAKPPAATPAAGPVAASNAPYSTATPGASMKPETERMSADQKEIEIIRYSQRLAALEAEVAEHRKARIESEERAMYAEFRQQVDILCVTRDSINTDKEVEWCKSRKYSQDQLKDHVEMLRRIPAGDSIVTGGFIPTIEAQRQKRGEESATKYSGDPDRDFKRSVEVQRYSRQNPEKTIEQCEQWWVENHNLNGVAH